jgi:transposase
VLQSAQTTLRYGRGTATTHASNPIIASPSRTQENRIQSKFRLPLSTTVVLKALVATLLGERDQERRRAEEQAGRAAEQQRRANDLHIENRRLQVELARYKKWYYGPRADQLQSEGELAQMLLRFAETLDGKPTNPDDVAPHTEPQEELRRVKRRKGRRNLANFDNLPTTTHVYELSREQRTCPCCGLERKEIGADESWQIEYYPGHFERLHHVRKKYACPACEHNGENPRMETAAKPETAIEKGLAGPGLLAYIATSKFADYVGFPVM